MGEKNKGIKYGGKCHHFLFLTALIFAAQSNKIQQYLIPVTAREKTTLKALK